MLFNSEPKASFPYIEPKRFCPKDVFSNIRLAFSLPIFANASSAFSTSAVAFCEALEISSNKVTASALLKSTPSSLNIPFNYEESSTTLSIPAFNFPSNSFSRVTI